MIHLVHETFGTQQNGPWNLVLSKLSVSIFGSCQVILDRTKYQRSFGVDQTSYGCFEQNQVSCKVSIEILRTKFKPRRHWRQECLFCMNSFLVARNHRTKMKLRGLCKIWTGKICPSVRELKLCIMELGDTFSWPMWCEILLATIFGMERKECNQEIKISSVKMKWV